MENYDGLRIISAKAETFVHDYGQMVRGFELVFDRDVQGLKAAPANFALENAPKHPLLPDQSAGVTAVKAVGEKLLLQTDPFLYEKDFRVTLVKNGQALVSFTAEDISSMSIDVADLFAPLITDTGVNYRLYVPEAGGPLPLVVWFHGGGERGDDNLKPLTHNRGAVAFAEPAYQQRHPCIVLAVQSVENWTDGELEAAASVIRGLIASGKADPDRIYAIGLAAFQSTLRFAAHNKDLLAAVVPIIYWSRDDTDMSVLADMPMWGCIAEHDIFGGSQRMVDFIESMRALGNDRAKCTVYTDAEMAEFGLFGGLLHWSWIPTLNSTQLMDWMFAQSRSKEE